MSTLDFCRRSRRPFFQKPHMAWISTRCKLHGETRFWKCNFGIPSREKHNRYICLIYGAVPIVVFKNFVKKSQHDMSERFEISLYIYIKIDFYKSIYMYTSTLGNTLNLYIPLMHIDMCRFRSSCVLLCRWHGHVWIHAGHPLGWMRAMSLILVNGCRLPIGELIHGFCRNIWHHHLKFWRQPLLRRWCPLIDMSGERNRLGSCPVMDFCCYHLCGPTYGYFFWNLAQLK